MKTTVAIVDDHELMAKALSGLIQKFDDYEVIFECFSGEDLIRKFTLGMAPEIVLLDIHMPNMDGYEVAQWLSVNQPSAKILALSMNEKEDSIIKMLRNGARGYLLKGCKTYELKEALDAMRLKGVYYSEFVTGQLVKSLSPSVAKQPAEILSLNEREKTFIQLACSDLTYVEIADKMCVSPRTVDGYRESVFVKMDVKSRVGMVIKAIKLKLVDAV
jgi:two-component system invasion response regulator UvrY